MRDKIITYLQSQLNGDIKCSSELPWSSGDEPLYIKNMKKIYVDKNNIEQNILIPLLSPSNDIIETVTTVRAYMAVDAKTTPSSLEATLITIEAAKDISTITNVVGRECDYNTEYQGDILIYTFEFRFTNIT